ncbi:hypothetical protein [uncultured Jatrophihabitans sp.]|uniref:hypothetical protein n=1 Tax=uncultured Jatrophihabitans sp. TaxID=1610747 RepID=UPI0035CB2C0E
MLSHLKPTPWGELSTPRKVRRVVGIVSQIGALGMVASALTSESEVGLRADGSTRKEHKDDESVQGDAVQGDPKVKAQRDQAGEEKDSTGSGDTEAQSGNAAEDTEKAADSTS